MARSHVVDGDEPRWLLWDRVSMLRALNPFAAWTPLRRSGGAVSAHVDDHRARIGPDTGAAATPGGESCAAGARNCQRDGTEFVQSREDGPIHRCWRFARCRRSRRSHGPRGSPACRPGTGFAHGSFRGRAQTAAAGQLSLLSREGSGRRRCSRDGRFAAEAVISRGGSSRLHSDKTQPRDRVSRPACSPREKRSRCLLHSS